MCAMGKEGKKSKMREGQVEEMGVPLKDDLLVDEMDAADISPSLVQDGENMEQQAGASGSGKNKSKSDKKEKKRKEAVAFALAITGNEASKPSKKQKVGKQLTTGEEGGVVEVKTRSGKDEGWDKRIEGQKFGEWRCAGNLSPHITVFFDFWAPLQSGGGDGGRVT